MAKTPLTVLGISYSHGDSSAALVVDGVLVAACEEERFSRKKHDASFPRRAIEYCLSHAKLAPRDVKVVAVARKPNNALFRKIWFSLKHPNVTKKVAGSKHKISLAEELQRMGLRPRRIEKVEHHLAHLWSARFLATDEETALFSFDGLGDFVSASAGRANGPRIDIFNRVYYPHSLGFFYSAMTQYLGFPYFGDEFKVMGLSAYGQPTYLKEMREIVREDEKFGFKLNFEALPIAKSIGAFEVRNDQPHVNTLYASNFLTQLLGIPPRKAEQPLNRMHWDLAKSIQTRFEEIASHCLNQLHKKAPSDSIALAGGCAHNSVWVGKILKQTPFKNVWVAPASHDAGIAVGAAAAASRREDLSAEGGHWALLGPSHDESAHSPFPFSFEVSERSFAKEQALCDWMVDCLTKGQILGLVQGRMEFGPRALGSRSILADPRVADMKERLNSRVKHREAFRPFAASVLWEFQQDWFNDSFYAPTMEAVFEVKTSSRNQIPGVVHSDNSCRIQSVKKETQPFFWRLLDTFRKKTGVPMLINTSFNDCEPVVCSQKDAMACFSHADIDHLIIGNRAISRLGQEIALTA